MALTNQKKRSIAERLIIEDGKTGEYVSDFLDISSQTVSRWRKGRKGEKTWDERRTENLSAPHKIKELLQKQLELVASGEKATIDADSLSKISKVLQDVSSKVSTQVVLSVLEEFDNWFSEIDPEKALEITKIHRAFLIYKATLE
ncbi:MAG: hypothetical protein V3V28_08680 [Polaribacter sp.]|uniref:hypothetical protein n=1 Tax=Polaribacter sp. TaxID=1920175 RepID=UPI002F357B46